MRFGSRVKFIVLMVWVGIGLSQAATIVVDGTNGVTAVDGVCSINEAIVAANGNESVNECTAGEVGEDIIRLTGHVTLTQFHEADGYGNTGLISIGSEIILDGQGFTIQRDNTLFCNRDDVLDASEFRLIRVLATGDLELNHVQLAHGCIDGTEIGFPNAGAGVLNLGTLAVINTIIRDNTANRGGGIQNQKTITNIQNSIIRNNTATLDGGGIQNQSPGTIINMINNSIDNNTSQFGVGLLNYGTTNLLQSTTFSGNIGTANSQGGGLYNWGTINNFNNNTFYDNTATHGAGLYNRFSGTIFSLSNSTFSTNSATTSGGAIFNEQDGTITLRNSLLHMNTAVTSGADCEGFLIGTFNLSNNGSGGCPGLLSPNLDPATVSTLTDNGCDNGLADGTCVQTVSIAQNSQAIDATGSGATSGGQRGLGVGSGSRDIGAFELLTDAEQCANINMGIIAAFSTTVFNAQNLNNAIFCANLNANTTDQVLLGDDIELVRKVTTDTGLLYISSAIKLDGNGHQIQRARFLNCQLDETRTADEFGLLQVSTTGDLDLKNILLLNGCNDARIGGAINNKGQLRVENVIFSENSANFSGAVDNTGSISVIKNVQFIENTALIAGGALYVYRGELGSIKGTTFMRNVSGTNGAALFINESDVDLIENSTFSNNTAIGAGGGITIRIASTVNAIKNSSFIDNQATTGAGISAFDSTIIGITNNLFSENTATDNSADCHVFNPVQMMGNNNHSDQDDHNCTGADISGGLDASLIDTIADNGCTTPLPDGSCVLTHALMSGSFAIDAGDNNATTIDQREFIAVGQRDVGAFEFGAAGDLIFRNSFDD
ncbi:choice-of-anchor Q domain-containing protein [Marinicella rhabdoformis]|uniref:choice-of-anchor Q domain-containing protein n=1 Tax=Marinicella rhabdoformis TaxID=2580566 RepID=UPI0012AEBDF9|nr:choice-of-anchor Q domain-containing protein [Marinicella rhabdoformis]